MIFRLCQNTHMDDASICSKEAVKVGCKSVKESIVSTFRLIPRCNLTMQKIYL